MAVPLDTSYEPFSQEPEYLAVNRAFIDSLPWAGYRGVVDIACGTGVLTELTAGRLTSAAPSDRAWVVGVDISRQSLTLASRTFRERALADQGRDGPPVALVEGLGDRLPVADSTADTVLVGNAIHLFDLPRLLDEVVRVLRHGGRLAFNTSFYAGTFEPGTEAFYTEWIKQALLHIGRVDASERAAGLLGVRRRKGSASAAFSRPWLTVDEYADILAAHGIAVDSTTQRPVVMNARSFESVGAYAGLATVLLSGYPAQLACDALQRAVVPALEVTGLQTVRRRWLEVVGHVR